MEKLLTSYPLYLSVTDVAEILDVTPKTVRILVKKGSIKSIRVGRLIRIPKDKLIVYLESALLKEEEHE